MAATILAIAALVTAIGGVAGLFIHSRNASK